MSGRKWPTIEPLMWPWPTAVHAEAQRLSSTGNVHRIVVTETRLECADGCTGSEPHISEYRALNVQGG